MTTATQSLGKVPPPLLRSLQKLNGSASNIGSNTPMSPRSFGTETTGKSSVTDEEMFFMLMEASQDDGSFFESPVRNAKQTNSNMWKSVPNFNFDPNASPGAASTTWDFAGFDEEKKVKKTPKSISATSDHAHVSRRNTVSSLPKDTRSSSSARPTMVVQPVEFDRRKASTVDETPPAADLESKLSKTMKKKRIKVRASDLSLDSSCGSTAERQQMQEAVRRWQSEHSTPSTDGDLSAMQRSIQRRRSSLEDRNADALQGTANGAIRVVIRRTKSLDDSSTMNQSQNSSESRLARPKRRTRSKSRGRLSRTGTPGIEHECTQETTCAEASTVSSPKSRSRSMSRARRCSVADSPDEVCTGSPKRSISTRRTRSRSRARPTAVEGTKELSSPDRTRSKSLGRHFQESNHEPQDRVNAERSCGRSVSQRSAVSAPSRVGTGSLLQRRRSRSLARPSSSSEEPSRLPVQAMNPLQTPKPLQACKPLQTSKPLHQQHPMNDLSRNRQPGDVKNPGSAAFQSKYAAVEEEDPMPQSKYAAVEEEEPKPPKATEFAEEKELIRLIQETGITPEQFLKLREAGYMLTPEE